MNKHSSFVEPFIKSRECFNHMINDVVTSIKTFDQVFQRFEEEIFTWQNRKSENFAREK